MILERVITKLGRIYLLTMILKSWPAGSLHVVGMLFSVIFKVKGRFREDERLSKITDVR